MQTLPLGYAPIHELDFIFITFGIICLFVAIKLTTWLLQGHSNLSRICCIITGSLFLYTMINKSANDLVQGVIAFIFCVLLFLFVVIPTLIVGHNFFFPIFKGLVPSVFTYYKFLFSLFPRTKCLSNLCDNAKKRVDTIEEKHKNRTIINAYNWCDTAVRVECSDGDYFSISGKLHGYTANSVSILIAKNWLKTYDAHGRQIGSRTI